MMKQLHHNFGVKKANKLNKENWLFIGIQRDTTLVHHKEDLAEDKEVN